ncbi:MAG: hypothetical protein SOY85_06095 [Blautia sp.]|uniref:hypothetical protein n=1 Tax=Blautia sp. TaxID=1955243 RepID=UPI002A825684|nr:hypothetical protein [Blautia sp.]MCI5964138.1 hypothetical protein [Clostridia bacterium]MDY4054436.1 hypothetical protein [Blautia sp.]
MSKFLKFIVNLVVICAILVAAALLVPPFAGVNTVMNDNSSKDTNLPVCSVAYGREIDAASLKKGDKIIYTNNNKAYVYKVTDMDSSAGSYKVKSVYDKNAKEETVQLINNAVKVVVVVPYIAYAAIALQSKEGLIVVGLGVIFLIILFILAELWRKDEADDEDDEDEDEEASDEEDSEDDEDEDDDEEEKLSRRERKRLKKEEKRRKKLAKKGLLDEEETEDEEEEAPVLEAAPVPEKQPDEYDSAMKDAMASIAESIAKVQNGEIEAPDKVQETIVPQETAEIILGMEDAEETESSDASAVEMVSDDSAVQETAEKEAAQPQEETAAQEEVQQEEEMESEPEEVPVVDKEAVLPAPSVTELLSKAEAAGESPEVIEDKDNEVTLLDYSKLI